MVADNMTCILNEKSPVSYVSTFIQKMEDPFLTKKRLSYETGNFLTKIVLQKIILDRLRGIAVVLERKFSLYCRKYLDYSTKKHFE